MEADVRQNDPEARRFEARSTLPLGDYAGALDGTTSVDVTHRMTAVAAAMSTTLVDVCSTNEEWTPALANIVAFRTQFASEAATALTQLRIEYLEGRKGPIPAKKYLGHTGIMYEFVRITLDIPMHGLENLRHFEGEPGVEEVSVGQNISRIYEAMRDGSMQRVLAQMLRQN